MDLWIRSQNKKTLTKVTSITLNSSSNSYVIEDEKGYMLGKYSKERALEVLDEIKNKINTSYQFYTVNKQNYNDYTGDHIYRIPLQTPVIYEMPKE